MDSVASSISPTSLPRLPRRLLEEEAPFYHNFPTTTAFLFLISLLFLYQIRKKRKDVVMHYQSIIVYKQYYRFLRAWWSHPGCKGLPLLLYNSLLIWHCRELEHEKWSYPHLLWSVSWMAFALDFFLTYLLLHTLKDMHNGRSTPLGLSSSNASPSSTRLLLQLQQRPRGSVTVTAAALWTIWYKRSDDVSSLWTVVVYYGALILLIWLSLDVHFVTGVLCGCLSGWAYVAGVTRFAAMPYFSNASLTAYGILVLVSLGASPDYGHYLHPLIDFVSWNEKGEWVEDDAAMDVRLESIEQHGVDAVNDSSYFRGNTSNESTLPLFEPLSFQEQQPHSDEDTIHRRLPAFLTDDDDEITDDIEMGERRSLLGEHTPPPIETQATTASIRARRLFRA